MAYTEIYCDPSIAADSGTGTVGDPYGDLEYAFEQGGQGAGTTRMNVKTGTDEVLAAALNGALTTGAWSTSSNTPLIIEGYSTAAGDLRGTTTTAGISGGGAIASLLTVGVAGISFVHMHLHNTTGAIIAGFGDDCGIVFCELDNTTGSAVGSFAAGGFMVGCYLHNIGANGLASSSDNAFIGYNLFEDGTNTFTFAIQNFKGMAFRNIINLTGNGTGIDIAAEGSAIHNAIYSAGGTGTGIQPRSSQAASVITNNLVEGFSGTGGIGIDYANGAGVAVFGANGVYNCATAYTAPSPDEHYAAVSTAADETLSASPFTSPGTGDFSPVDTDNVKEGAFPDTIGGGL